MLREFLIFFKNEFKIRDQILLAIVLCCFAMVFMGLVLFSIPVASEIGDIVMSVAQAIAEWTGLVFLLLNGTITKSKYWNYIVACLFIVALSMVFGILHLPGSIELMFIGIILLEIVYTIRFVGMSYTSPSGWLKYGWICSWCVVTVGLRIHRIPEWSSLVPAVFFWLTIYFFLQEKMEVARKYKGYF